MPVCTGDMYHTTSSRSFRIVVPAELPYEVSRRKPERIFALTFSRSAQILAQKCQETEEAEDNEAERIVAASSSLQNHPQDGSVDSMRTMFSNSVTLPVGTFRELDQSHSATTNNDAKNAVK